MAHLSSLDLAEDSPSRTGPHDESFRSKFRISTHSDFNFPFGKEQAVNHVSWPGPVEGFHGFDSKPVQTSSAHACTGSLLVGQDRTDKVAQVCSIGQMTSSDPAPPTPTPHPPLTAACPEIQDAHANWAALETSMSGEIEAKKDTFKTQRQWWSGKIGASVG